LARWGQIEETKLRHPYKITFCRKGYCKKLNFCIKISLVQWVVAWLSHQSAEDAKVPLLSLQCTIHSHAVRVNSL